MAQFPDNLYTPRTVVNRNGVVYDEAKTKVIFAEDLNAINDEIVAIEEYVLDLPAGGGGGDFPFYLADGSPSNISLTEAGLFPFYLADGSPSDIALV
jgi:hypothetical protein